MTDLRIQVPQIQVPLWNLAGKQWEQKDHKNAHTWIHPFLQITTWSLSDKWLFIGYTCFDCLLKHIRLYISLWSIFLKRKFGIVEKHLKIHVLFFFSIRITNYELCKVLGDIVVKNPKGPFLCEMYNLMGYISIKQQPNLRLGNKGNFYIFLYILKYLQYNEHALL